MGHLLPSVLATALESLNMSLEDDFTAALDAAYQRTGREVNYWARRFIQSLRRNGGLATARRMLKPRTSQQRKGLDALLEANRPELSLEAIVLQPQFQPLFTETELAVARERLGEYGKRIKDIRGSRERLFPDELELGRAYAEGAKKTVRVNAHERNPRARQRCIKRYGAKCVVCGFDFQDAYGELGKDFIHVHHLKPLALTDGKYRVRPVEDLRPVCPNCHAMLHRPENLLEIDELKSLVRKHRRRS